MGDDKGKITADPEVVNNPEAKVSDETPPVTTIVSATRYEIPLEKSTRFATVITRDEIEKSGKVYTIAVAAGALADSMAMTARVTGDIFEGSHVIAPEKVEAKGTDGNWKAVSLPEH